MGDVTHELARVAQRTAAALVKVWILSVETLAQLPLDVEVHGHGSDDLHLLHTLQRVELDQLLAVQLQTYAHTQTCDVTLLCVTLPSSDAV